ncbi:dUTP diphosphatase [Enterococcus nangangensis]
MEKLRGFEVVSKYQDANLSLPERATAGAAGYDFAAAADVVVPSLYQALQKGESVQPVLVPTGIKAYMQKGEYLEIVNRSSNSRKRFLSMPNGVGIIDEDYYNSAETEGHIMFQFVNFGLEDVVIKKGERIGQGIFKQFLMVDGDVATGVRTGGFGSSGVN